MTLILPIAILVLLPEVLIARDMSDYAAAEVAPGGALLQVQQQTRKVDKDQPARAKQHSILSSLVLETAKVKKTEAIAKSRSLDASAKMLEEHQGVKTYKQCPLPANATWCQVGLTGLPPYMMAVRSGVDVVSSEVCTKGFWETQDFSAYGPPGHAMDIGGNMGYFTFALAHAGWHVTTFEPMKANLDLMAATLCANPSFAQKVEIHQHGLGAQNTNCRFVYHKGNVGNGITRCIDDTNMWWEDIDKDFEYGPEEYRLRKFDEVIDELKMQGKLQSVDFLKIDVEGYECEVLKGAPEFLTKFSPKLVKTEVWPHLERCEPAEYLTKYVDAGYTVARDVGCAQLEHDLVHAGGDYYLCKM